MLRNAPPLRRGALLIRGPSYLATSGSRLCGASQSGAAPRPGHECVKGRYKKCSAVVELVEVAHRLHDRLEIRSRIERVEQLRGIRQQAMRPLNRDPDIVLRRVGQAAMSRQQNLRIQTLQPLQRLNIVGDAAGG